MLITPVLPVAARVSGMFIRMAAASSLVFFCVTVLLFCQLAVSASSQVLSPPTAQEVILNRNASFNCTTAGSAKWVIRGSHDDTIKGGQDVPPELHKRGFIPHWTPLSNNKYFNELTVLGSIENNNTEIDCQLKRGQTEPTVPVMLTVIGPPDAPRNVAGSVEQLSPALVRLVLEWQAPFSHHEHRVLHYTVYAGSSNTNHNTTAFSVDIHTDSEEFSSCKTLIGVTATNDIGESGRSNVTFILKVPVTAGFTVDGKIFTQTDASASVLELRIQFPELCPGQHMYYTVKVTEVLSGDIVYQHTAASVYTGEVLLYSGTTAGLMSINYSVVVLLETERGNASSQPVYLSHDSRDIEESSSGVERDVSENEDHLVIVIAVLCTVVVLCLLMVTVIIAVVFVRKKSPLGRSNEMNQTVNPIYEGPLYENMEEHQNNISPPTYADRSHLSRAFNKYQSSPINIPSGVARAKEELEFYAVAASKKSRNSRSVEEDEGEGEIEGEGEGEGEGTYTIMRTPTGISFTPSREDRNTWLGIRD